LARAREAVYLPEEDAFLTEGYPTGEVDVAGMYVYRTGENAWYRADIPAPPGRKMQELAAQNRAMAFDPKRNLVLMVLGEHSGNLGKAVVYGLKYRK